MQPAHRRGLPLVPVREVGTLQTVLFTASMWRDVAEFQATERITTEAEALRRLVQLALRAEKRKAQK
jgi:hypothetical protein